MFSSITSYLWGAAEEETATTPENTTQETETAAAPATPSPKSRRRALKTKPAENEWVLVETSSREASSERQSTPSSPTAGSRQHECVGCGLITTNRVPCSCGTAPPLTTGIGPLSETAPVFSDFNGATTNSDPMHSSMSDTCSDVSTLPDGVVCSDESWLVTPPPCFTSTGCESPDGMESNPLENLLIEHPSMSVYGPRGRQNSDGDESVGSESEEEAMAEEAIAEEPSPAVRGRPMTATVRHPPRRAHAVAARAGLVAQTVRAQRTSQRVKHRVEMRNNRRNALHRHNKTIVVRSGPSPHVKPRVVCQPSARSNTRC